MNKIVRDRFGVKIKYPERSCKQCINYPCFTGIENCKCDFARYGCVTYIKKNDSV